MEGRRYGNGRRLLADQDFAGARKGGEWRWSGATDSSRKSRVPALDGKEPGTTGEDRRCPVVQRPGMAAFRAVAPGS